MKAGPVQAAKLLSKVLTIDAAPRPAKSWIAHVALISGWFSTEGLAYEAADRWEKDFLSLLRRDMTRLSDLGRPCVFAFNSSSDYMVQGAAYEEPGDSDDLKDAKRKRRRFSEYIRALRELDARDFEAVCAGILKAFGATAPVLTQYSADEGIDFYGRLQLKGSVFFDDLLPNVSQQMSVWLIGQAKHYLNSRVSTFEVRDLVGAVSLARARAFGGSVSKYHDLQLRPCDAVFYLIFSTGQLSRATWALIERSGVIGMDGDMVAAFLADQGIGVERGQFSPTRLRSWINRFREQ